MKRLFFTVLMALVVACFPLVSQAKKVTIIRDNYGIPHIYGHSLDEVFYGYGYALAQDRLFQLEILRRSYYGRIAEIYGEKFVKFDTAMRTNNLTREEINRQMYTLLEPDHIVAIKAMAEGINRYIEEAMKNRQRLLPREFIQHGFTPTRWTGTDISAVFLSVMGIFMDISREQKNLGVLKEFINLHGEQTGKEIFSDWAWVNDPGAYTTISGKGASLFSERNRASRNLAVYVTALTEESKQVSLFRQEVLGDIGSGGFSYCVVVDGEKSATGNPILMGGPQFGFQAPSALHEVGLHGGGLDVVGSTLVGYPFIMFGHTATTAFSSTAGLNNIVDHYEEKLNPANKYQYWYKGEWRDMEKREEIIKVKGGQDVKVTLYRTVHGPVFARGDQVAYSKRLSCREDYLLGLVSFFEVMRAKTVDEFRKAAQIGTLTINQFYADSSGNIAYFHQGKNPIRPAGVDPRLPTPGTGEYEWIGFVPRADNPFVANPAQGYIINWNNKPSPNWPNGDISSGFGSSAAWGEENRAQWIDHLLNRREKITVNDMKWVIRQINDGNLWAFSFKKYLIDAIDRVGGENPELAEAKRLLLQWNNLWEDQDENGFYDSPGLVIFQAWWEKVIKNTFEDEFGKYYKSLISGYGPFSWNKRKRYSGHPLFMRALKGKDAALPLSRDYFAPKGRDRVLVDSLAQAINELKGHFKGLAMAEWGNRTIKVKVPIRPTTLLRIPSSAGPSLTMPFMERGTENHIVELAREGAMGINVTPLGASGFVDAEGKVGKHFSDQLNLFVNWQYKPMLFNRDEVEQVAESRTTLTF
ncbi:MAG: penicillin acylase family protein [Deltaproteobacteria bacterium]|nr:penicillin acylase family protein [Deltaproteobacteria bacterium]